MKELAESKPLYKVTLKNGREIITSINSDLIEKAVMTAKMIKLSWILVNTDMISTVEPYNGDDIDHYLVWLNDDVMIDRLKKILLERKGKNLQTRWVKHLMQIYTDRFWEISNDKSQEW